jgi:transposase-like protein
MGQEDKKAEVVLEYLKGGVTLRGLEKKHGINFRQIHRWVKEYEGAKGPEGEEKGAKVWRRMVTRDAELSTDVRRLRKELEEARLYNKLLNAMIDIAEEQFDIPIRKKPGAKRR